MANVKGQLEQEVKVLAPVLIIHKILLKCQLSIFADDKNALLSNHLSCKCFTLFSSQVYFDMQIAGKDVGRITIGLFGKVVPRTVANFRGVAEGFIDPVSSTL